MMRRRLAAIATASAVASCGTAAQPAAQTVVARTQTPDSPPGAPRHHHVRPPTRLAAATRPPSRPATLHATGGGPSWVNLVRLCIRRRESGGNYRAVDPAGTSWGAYQFLDATWHAVTGLSGHASSYPPAVQDSAFLRLFAGGRGRHQWTTYGWCRAEYGGPI